jgi:hypothetical protein
MLLSAAAVLRVATGAPLGEEGEVVTPRTTGVEDPICDTRPWIAAAAGMPDLCGSSSS